MRFNGSMTSGASWTVFRLLRQYHVTDGTRLPVGVHLWSAVVRLCRNNIGLVHLCIQICTGVVGATRVHICSTSYDNDPFSRSRPMANLTWQLWLRSGVWWLGWSKMGFWDWADLEARVVGAMDTILPTGVVGAMDTILPTGGGWCHGHYIAHWGWLAPWTLYCPLGWLVPWTLYCPLGWLVPWTLYCPLAVVGAMDTLLPVGGGWCHGHSIACWGWLVPWTLYCLLGVVGAMDTLLPAGGGWCHGRFLQRTNVKDHTSTTNIPVTKLFLSFFMILKLK